jgi:hypothetical protein
MLLLTIKLAMVVGQLTWPLSLALPDATLRHNSAGCNAITFHADERQVYWEVCQRCM